MMKRTTTPAGGDHIMKRLSILTSTLVVGLLAALSARPAHANDFDKLTYFTFSAPVEIPGASLPAGTYTFRLADLSSRNVVQVFSRDGKTLYSTFFAIRDTRPEPADDPTVTFYETAAGSPQAIKTWFYPGERTGFEFIYPKEQATKIASVAASGQAASSIIFQ
jgi:hypothetical protein